MICYFITSVALCYNVCHKVKQPFFGEIHPGFFGDIAFILKLLSCVTAWAGGFHNRDMACHAARKRRWEKVRIGG
jgi:hypothetical protein